MSRRAWIGGLVAALLLIAPAAAGASTFTVVTFGDGPVVSCGPSRCTLRDALAAANANPGLDTIVVPAGTYSVIGTLGVLNITQAVTITGQDHAVLDSDGGGRIFDVNLAGSPTPPNDAVTISHLTIQNGTSTDSNGGGAVLVHNSSVTLDHDVFQQNWNNLKGGAIETLGGATTITDSTLQNNRAYQGGALDIEAGTVNVDRTLWYDNGFNTGGGGAIYNRVGFLNVEDSTFVANVINAGNGGAIYASASTGVRNTTFEGNVASGNPGGSAIYSVTHATLTNDLFADSGYGISCAAQSGFGFVDNGGNLDEGTSCGLAAGRSNQMILLGPLTDNGGAARSLLPWAGSPGPGLGGTSCLPSDQRGVTRAPGQCDVGAVTGASASGVPAPAVSAGEPEEVDAGTVSIDALIDRFGVDTFWTVDYGPTTAYGATDGQFDASFGTDLGPQDNNDTLYNLADGTTYHYRVTATNAGGTTVGPDETIRLNGAPDAATLPGSTTSPDSATLNGVVNPAGAITTYHFEYGPTGAYGTSTADADAGHGLGGTPVSATLTGLAPGTTIHYRLVATNDTGTTTGGDQTATTVAAAPTATPSPQATVSPTATPAPTATPTPIATPAPQFEKTVVVKPAGGTVLVKLPHSSQFVPLSNTESLPDGTIVDTRKGKIQLSSVTKRGQVQTALFYDGLFQISQNATTTDLTLVETLAACPKSGKASAAAKKPKSRKLWGDGSGNFRTRGHYSAATVRGTTWLVQDTCAGTLTRVTHGVVSVRDNVKNKTIVVRAGKRYLARPR